MKIVNTKKIFLIILAVTVSYMTASAAQAAETNFSISSLNASDVNCKECHTNTPHIIHASKPVTCENCHGDKKSVDIPKCTKCHDGPIHKVHAGKIDKGCSYCHKDVGAIHTNFTSEAVCSHCHKDLIEVHGKDQSCIKCHKTPPEIVKPLKSPETTLVCQICHNQTNVAAIHGNVDNKQACYNCHKGTSQLNGSDVPHTIHQNKASCKDCHEENGKVAVPQCPKCHDIDKLHSFKKIGKSTSTLSCQVCHPSETNPAKVTVETSKNNITEIGTPEGVNRTDIAPKSQQKEGPLKVPGFSILSGIITLYLIRRIIR